MRVSWASLRPFPDQEPPALILVQGKLLDRHSFSPLAIRLQDRPACYHFATQLDGMRQNGPV
jgi:hypothetical protein